MIPQPQPPATRNTGKRISSVIASSVGLLFGLLFAPLGIVAAVNVEPLGAAWDDGSNFINTMALWFFAFAALMFLILPLAAGLLAGRGKSPGLLAYAIVVAVLLLVGGVSLAAAAAITMSG